MELLPCHPIRLNQRPSPADAAVVSALQTVDSELKEKTRLTSAIPGIFGRSSVVVTLHPFSSTVGLSWFRAAPSTDLSHVPFKRDEAFAAQC
jgi:hypothetical protein